MAEGGLWLLTCEKCLLKLSEWPPSQSPGYGEITNPRIQVEFQWPRGLRRSSDAAGFLGLGFRIPPATWMPFSCACCVLSGRGLFVGLITRPEEPYCEFCVWVWSWSLGNEKALAHCGALAPWGFIEEDNVTFERPVDLVTEGTDRQLAPNPRPFFYRKQNHKIILLQIRYKLSTNFAPCVCIISV